MSVREFLGVLLLPCCELTAAAAPSREISTASFAGYIHFVYLTGRANLLSDVIYESTNAQTFSDQQNTVPWPELHLVICQLANDGCLLAPHIRQRAKHDGFAPTRLLLWLRHNIPEKAPFFCANPVPWTLLFGINVRLVCHRKRPLKFIQ
jgi:hypothetical protein